MVLTGSGVDKVLTGWRVAIGTLMSLSANPPCIKITLRLPKRVKTFNWN